MTVTPDGLWFGPGGLSPKPPEPPPAISGHLPLIIRPDGAAAPVTEIPPHGRLVTGSSADADLTLPGMTPQHAVFYVHAGEWAVASFTASHSWLVTGETDEPLFGPHVLRRGDRIKLGTVTFTADAPA